MNRAQRRQHLETVILSARLRDKPNESVWAMAALDTSRPIAFRVDFLRASLAVESPSGDADTALVEKWAKWLVAQK